MWAIGKGCKGRLQERLSGGITGRPEHPEEGDYKAKGTTCSSELPSCVFSGCE